VQHRLEGRKAQGLLGRGIEQVLDPGRIERLVRQIPLPAAPVSGTAADRDLGAGHHLTGTPRLDAVAAAGGAGHDRAQAPGRAAAPDDGQFGPPAGGVGDQQLRQFAIGRDRHDFQPLPRPRHEWRGPEANLIPLPASGGCPGTGAAGQQQRRQLDDEQHGYAGAHDHGSRLSWSVDCGASRR